MAYTPNNLAVYTQAFSGAVAGLLGQSTPLGTTRGQYTKTINIAGAWAQEVDTKWNTADDPDSFENAEIFAFSNDLFQVYEPQPDTGTTGIGSSTNPATYANTALDLLAVLADGETYLDGQGIAPPSINESNLGWMNDQATTNGQGDGGPTTVAIVQAVVRGSGIFRWAVSGAQPAAAGTEVVTWRASYETGVGAVTTTGGTAATLGEAAVGGKTQYASAATGTGIVVTAGGGADEALASEAGTVGTAAVGSSFAASGILQNNVAGTPFAQGSNVILKLGLTNSATNRVVSSMNVSLEEI